MTKLIALCGPAGCGKTTAAEMFMARGYDRLPFADPLKQICRDVLGVPPAYLWGDRKESIPPGFAHSGRQILQRVGTDCFRTISPNCWLRAWQRAFELRGEPIIVDDCRFQNEAALIQSLGGSVILVHREGVKWGAHPSENDLSAFKFDGQLSNHGSLTDLQAAVDTFADVCQA